MGFFSDVKEFIFGEDSSRARADIAARSAQSTNLAERARADVLGIVPRGQAAQQAGFQGAFDILSGAIPQQINAILGQPVNFAPGGGDSVAARLRQALSGGAPGATIPRQQLLSGGGLRAPVQAGFDGSGGLDGTGFGGGTPGTIGQGFDIQAALSGLFSNPDTTQQLGLPASFDTTSTINTAMSAVPGPIGITGAVMSGLGMLDQVQAELANQNAPQLSLAQIALAATPLSTLQEQMISNLQGPGAPGFGFGGQAEGAESVGADPGGDGFGGGGDAFGGGDDPGAEGVGA